MLKNLPDTFILFDTEYTAWEGSQERKWTGKGERREIVQVGAVRVSNRTLHVESTYTCFIRPRYNPILSDYFKNLTHITQNDIDDHGISFPDALTQFASWAGDTEIYSFGRDGQVIQENCDIHTIHNPFRPGQFHNIREYFRERGVNPDGYYSSTIVEAFGLPVTRGGHNAHNDVLTILDALRALEKRERGDDSTPNGVVV